MKPRMTPIASSPNRALIAETRKVLAKPIGTTIRALSRKTEKAVPKTPPTLNPRSIPVAFDLAAASPPPLHGLVGVFVNHGRL